ncbi:MAG: ACT domain-containing protein, partial [Myxococcales bacterium]|nr:ACT domain-containing protein [Myxococcales bacterium]
DGAARAYFGHAAELEALETVALVVDEVARGRARYGVVPFETTSDGAVTATLMALVRSDVKICAELSIPASHQLASATGNGGDIEKIYGSTVALADCDRQVRRRFPQATLIDVPSGEMAAHFAREDHGSAALLPAFSAKDHGLVTIEERMEDEAGVEIRFAIVGAEHPFRTGTDRTVLAVALQDEPGALHASLRVFAERNVNLTRVESRPAHGAAWRYFFFLELDGHMTDRVVLAAVEELRSSAPFVKVLGSYPRPA